MRGDIQALVDEAATVLDAAVTLEDTSFALIAFGSQLGELDEVRRNSILHRRSSRTVRSWFESFGIATAEAPVLTPADASLGIRPRLCLPVRRDGVTYGYLWAYDWQRGLDGNALAAAGVATRIGEFLAADELAASAASSPSTPLSADVFDDLLAADATRVARGVSRWPLAADLQVVVVVVPDGAGEPTASEALVSTVRGNELVLLSASPIPGRVTRSVSRLRQGMGSVSVGPAGVGLSYRHARLAAQFSAGGSVVEYAELGALRLLAAEGAENLVADPCLLLLAEEPELRRTAQVFLDRAGNVGASAEELSIHRQTLYYRLGRVEELTGLNMRDGRDRLRLHLALLGAGLKFT